MPAMKRLALVATALSIACPATPRAPHAPDDRALRIQIAQAEAKRGAGIAELVELAAHGDAHARALALRGLGRIGGARAFAAIEPAIDDQDAEVAAAALDAIGVAASLDDGLGLQTRAASDAERQLGTRISLALSGDLDATRLASTDPRVWTARLDAIGRVEFSADSQRKLVALLAE